MRKMRGFWMAAVVVLSLAGPALAGTVIYTQGDLKWKDAGIPGVTTAAVAGDMAKGPSQFFLKYPAGFVTPVHHHSPDHHVTTISGNLVLILDGKEFRLTPGSYFSFTGKTPHAARCEGSEDCVMFVETRGAWDVVPEK